MSVELLTNTKIDRLRIAPLRKLSDFESAWADDVDLLALADSGQGRFVVGFAVSQRLIESALRLRYEVFNVELEKGLLTSRDSWMDWDQFDDQMTHCVLIDRHNGEVVGTYRLQVAKDGRALYCAQEYDLAPLEPLLPTSIECGRACIAKSHRSPQSVLQLWTGIGAFMQMHEAVHVFGCCSLTSIDPDDGWRAMKTLRRFGWLHPRLIARARPDYSCGDAAREFEEELGPAIPLPKLFHAYMRLGAKVVSEPAVDRAFGTVDFLVMIDRREVNRSALALAL